MKRRVTDEKAVPKLEDIKEFRTSICILKMNRNIGCRLSSTVPIYGTINKNALKNKKTKVFAKKN